MGCQAGARGSVHRGVVAKAVDQIGARRAIIDFGQLFSRPVVCPTFARNFDLIIAGLVVFRESSSTAVSALGWLDVSSQQAVMLERIDAMKQVIDENYAETPVERDDMTMSAQGMWWRPNLELRCSDWLT